MMIPAECIPGATVRWLNSSGETAVVVEPGYTKDPDYIYSSLPGINHSVHVQPTRGSIVRWPLYACRVIKSPPKRKTRP